MHFQLRNLLWATTSHDVYVMLDSAVNHWNPLTRRLTKVLRPRPPEKNELLIISIVTTTYLGLLKDHWSCHSLL